MQRIATIPMVSSRTALLDGVDPDALNAIATSIKAGCYGRKVDLQVHLALIDFDYAYAGWRYGSDGGNGAILLRKGSKGSCLINDVPRYTTSKDALDRLLALFPKMNLSSGFERFVRVTASATHIDASGSCFADIKIEGGKDPRIEAAARCGAMLRLIALVAEARLASFSSGRRAARRFDLKTRRNEAGLGS